MGARPMEFFGNLQPVASFPVSYMGLPPMDRTVIQPRFLQWVYSPWTIQTHNPETPIGFITHGVYRQTTQKAPLGLSPMDRTVKRSRNTHWVHCPWSVKESIPIPPIGFTTHGLYRQATQEHPLGLSPMGRDPIYRKLSWPDFPWVMAPVAPCCGPCFLLGRMDSISFSDLFIRLSTNLQSVEYVKPRLENPGRGATAGNCWRYCLLGPVPAPGAYAPGAGSCFRFTCSRFRECPPFLPLTQRRWGYLPVLP